MVHTCPRCELRFERDAELQEHLGVDHAADPESFVRHRYHGPAGDQAARDLAGRRRYLVVANQTLHSDRLAEVLQTRAEGGDASFVVVVPATPKGGDPGQPDESGMALAAYRARTVVDRLHEAGLDAVVEVGEADAYHAAIAVLEEDRFDEIVVSTLAPGVSRWLDADLAGRLARHTGLPVTTVVAAS